MQDKKTAMNGVRLFVLDMDGTVYLGDDPIGGALDFVREVDSSSDRDYLFFTNNASKVPSVYVEKLGKMGLEITEDKVVTAGDVCAEFLTENYPGARIYLNGTPLLYENWKEKGLKLVEDDPDVAVQSFDTTMTYEKMDRICDFVRGGSQGAVTLQGKCLRTGKRRGCLLRHIHGEQRDRARGVRRGRRFAHGALQRARQ